MPRPDSLRAEEHQLLAQRSRVLLALAVVIYLGFHGLDRLSAPDQAMAFLALRACVVVLYIGCAGLLNTDLGRSMALEISLFFTTLTSVGVAILGAWHAGWTSEYYLGILMAMFGACIFLPWTLGAASIFCGLSVGVYFALNLALYGISIDMVIPALFLSGTASVALVATELNARSRLRDHQLRGELQNAYGELKELDDLKTRFYANVSHELRTPLMLILGPLEELSERADGRSARLIESVENNALRLLRQVELLLDSAKAESGQLRCRPTAGNVGRSLSGLVEAARPQAERLGLSVHTSGLDEVEDSNFDSEWVETIAANLLSNAVKFTRSGGAVGVEAWSTPTMVCFKVTDSGIGIDETQLDAVFERFHQVDASASREAEGTGLGLSMVKELVELHGGVIVADSTLGSGSSFTVELPRSPEAVALHGPTGVLAGASWKRARSHAMLADLGLADLEPSTLATAPPDAPRIVIVEDNAELRTFLLERLSHHYRVEPAKDGLEGLEVIRRHPPDLVVSDVMMPHMDGLEMVANLREDALLSDLPVILLTARADVEDVVRGLDGGADDYVTKPFHVRELEARIDAVLRARAVERASDERASRLAAIGMMTSQIAHDLRNPLTSVVTFSALAQESVRDAGLAQAAEDLDAVMSETRRAVRMLKEVTDFAASGNRELTMEPFELGALLHELIDPLAASVAPAGVELRLELLTLAEIVGDREELRRAIENLVQNARDVLAPRGGGQVITRLEADGEGVVLRVMDSGPGLPPALLDTLFEPFATHGKREGTGLGLAIVRNAVQQHLGEIEAQAVGPLGGACFVLRFPARLMRPEGISARV